MANLFEILKTYRPRRVIQSDDFNDLNSAIKASFQKLGDEPAAGEKGVSTAFTVGTPTLSNHAVPKSVMDAAESGVLTNKNATDASAAAALASQNAAASSSTSASSAQTASQAAQAASQAAQAASETAKTASETAKTGSETAQAAALVSQNAAASSATASSTSAAAALVSENAAAASEAGVQSDANAAAASAAAALSSQNSSSSSESNSSASASASETSRVASVAAQAASEAAQTASETAKTASETAETNASNSSSSASTSAATATTKAGEASTSAAAALVSQNAAAASQSAASSSESNASSSAALAAASLDSFTDQYQGAQASDPATDPDGDAQVSGNLYFNNSSGMKVYNGSAWTAVAPTATSVTVSQVSDLDTSMDAFLTQDGTAAEIISFESNNFFAGTFSDKVTALGNTGSAKTIDLNDGNLFTATLNDNATLTLATPNSTSNRASSFTLVLTNDGTAGRTLAFAGGTFKYPGGSVSRTTDANKTDIWFFFTPDGGTTYYVTLPAKDLS